MEDRKFSGIHIIIVGAVMLAGLILGSFYDLEIDIALFSDRQPFWVFWTAVVSPFAAVAGFAFFGATLISNLKINKTLPKWFRFCLYFLGGGMIASGWYCMSKQIYSVNGYGLEGIMKLLTFAVSAVVIGGISVWGYFTGKKIKLVNYWLVVVVIAFLFGGPALVIPKIIKYLVSRPRFRTLVSSSSELTVADFHNWWEPFKDYKNYVNDVITSEEFRAFPSGHSAYSSMSMVFAIYLPYVSEKLKKFSVPLFYCGFVYFLITAFCRIRLGAHFLSDISMGGLLIIVSLYFCNMFTNKMQGFLLKTGDEE